MKKVFYRWTSAYCTEEGTVTLFDWDFGKWLTSNGYVWEQINGNKYVTYDVQSNLRVPLRTYEVLREEII